MQHRPLRRLIPIVLIATALACETDLAGSAPEGQPKKGAVKPLAQLEPCKLDPRVKLNLVPEGVCRGARLFFDEPFNGNGRTCGTCHPAENNYTLDRTEVRRRATLNPLDPLFVSADKRFDLDFLETAELDGPFALVLENVDGFEDLEFKYTSRAVSHTLSLATSIARDPADGSSASIKERTGWGGDGAPGQGTLREFADGAIAQHLTRDRARAEGSSFRLATEREKDDLLQFQLALGRVADLEIDKVHLTDLRATEGKTAFVDPRRGRCNHCHGNAGANFLDTGFNRNFATMNRGPLLAVLQKDGSYLYDGGFGGRNLSKPNLRTLTRNPDAYGNGSFSTPPLVEAADTGPFFHAHIAGSDGAEGIEAAVAFYASRMFANSKAGKELEAFFGMPLTLGGLTGDNIGRFLRVLNAAFNLSLTAQRLRAAEEINSSALERSPTVEQGLIRLATEELADALSVLSFAPGPDRLHAAEQAQLTTLVAQLRNAQNLKTRSERKALLAQAERRALAVKRALGSGLDFHLGTGNLMF